MGGTNDRLASEREGGEVVAATGCARYGYFGFMEIFG